MSDEWGARIGAGTALLTFAGLLVGGLGLLRWEWRQAHAFSQTTGRVVQSEVVASKHNSSEVQPSLWIHNFAYTYEVSGKTYKAKRIDSFIGNRSSDKASQEEAVARYPLGEEVSVHFDPTDHASAVLEPGITWVSVLFTSLGALGVCACFAVARYLKRRENPDLGQAVGVA